MDLHYSELFNFYRLDPITGDLSEPGHDGVGRPGVIQNNAWKLRWARAYWPATEVAWFLRYGRWPEGRVYTLDRNPFNVARGNLIMGPLGMVNDARRIVWAARAERRAVDLTACHGVHFDPAPRDRATFEQHRAEWAAERTHCARLGYPCPEFIAWDTDNAPDLDPLG